MSTPPTPVRVYGILPAAGMSRRMGKAAKQALRFGDTTLCGKVARTMLDSVNAVVVVTRTDLVGAMDLPEDDLLLVTFNDDPRSQMMDSIRIGLEYLDEVFCFSSGPARDAGILVLPADMPTVSVDACRTCIETFQNDPTRIIIAACKSRRGHPIIFPSGLRRTLSKIEGGLNELPKRRADLVQEVEISDPAILRDIDTQEDYKALDS